MRSSEAGKIFLIAVFLLMCVSPVKAQPPTRAILSPFVCENSGQSDVSAKFINSNGSITLNLRTNATAADDDYCGGVCDRIDGLAFNTLDMNIAGGCQSGFEVIFFGSDPVTGEFTSAAANCSDAVVTPGKGGFSHLHFTPDSFGYSSSPAMIQIYITQFATSSNANNVLIKNVVINNGSMTATTRLSGCQF